MLNLVDDVTSAPICRAHAVRSHGGIEGAKIGHRTGAGVDTLDREVRASQFPRRHVGCAGLAATGDAVGLEKPPLAATVEIPGISARFAYVVNDRLANKVGKSGIVYASDIDLGALTFLKEKAERQNIRNLKIIQGKADDPLLPDSAIDIVLIVNTVHLIDRPSEYLSNLKSCLQPDGCVVIVQWDAEKMDSEAPDWSAEDREKYTQRTLLRIIYDAGFEIKRILDFLPMQLIYICCPSKP